MHFSAFFEIYKIQTPLHRSKFKILAKFRQVFPIFSEIFVEFCIFLSVSSFFAPILMEFSRIFTNFNQKLPKSPEISKMLGIIGVTGFPNYYQLFRIIDNWGWGFGPEVGDVFCSCAGPGKPSSVSSSEMPQQAYSSGVKTVVGIVL